MEALPEMDEKWVHDTMLVQECMRTGTFSSVVMLLLSLRRFDWLVNTVLVLEGDPRDYLWEGGNPVELTVLFSLAELFTVVAKTRPVAAAKDFLRWLRAIFEAIEVKLTHARSERHPSIHLEIAEKCIGRLSKLMKLFENEWAERVYVSLLICSAARFTRSLRAPAVV